MSQRADRVGKKSFDPRWQEAAALCKWLNEHDKEEGDAREFGTRWDEYIKALEEIASDGLSSADRSMAQDLLNDIAVQTRARLPEVFHALADLAENAAAPDVRRQARNALRKATRQLPTAAKKTAMNCKMLG